MIVRVLGALGIGALAMYFYDPVSGKRRRALLRDQLTHARHEVRGYAESTAKDLRNRARGFAAEARGMLEKVRERRSGRHGQPAAVDIDVSPPQP